MNEQNKDINALIKRIEELPTLPIVSQKILEIAGNPNASVKDLISIVEMDQALATKILKIANSAFYGFLSRVNSIEHAVVLLGNNEIQSIVLGASVQNFFSGSNAGTFDRKRFWKHAIVCSQVAKYLGTHFRLKDDGSLFLSGLIHDVGKLVLDQYMHDGFEAIMEHIASKQTTFSQAEKAVLGTTHYQIAGKLLTQWRFPKNVVMPIFYHHAPWHDKNNDTACIHIYLANIFTKLAGYACHPNEKPIDADQFARSSEMDFVVKSGFELDRTTLDKLVDHIQEFVLDEAENMMRFFD